jgi:alpha-L-arabinofuranosidase
MLLSRNHRRTPKRGSGLFIIIATLIAVLFSIAPEAKAQTNQTVYADALGAGWEDWSWCVRDFNSTDFVHSGTKSIKATYSAAWQGLYFRHGAQDSSGFSDIVFWIHGGTTNGRNITVAAQLNDTSQNGVALNQYIQGGSVAAGVWRKVTIPLAALGAANKPNFNGFWLQDGSGGAQQPYYVDDITLVAVPPPSQIQVNIDATNLKRTIDPRLFGVAAAVWDAQFNTAGTTSLLAANGTRVSRFPGGSLSDDYHWATNTTGNNTWQWATNFDAFANVIRQINAQAYITVNYGSGSAQEAAGWVNYSNNTKGYNFRYWEVGNENYGSWENDVHQRAHDPYTYALAFRDYKNAMRAADSSIKVGAVVITGEDSYANYSDHPATNPRTGQVHNGWTPVMLATLKGLGVAPDFVIYHRYEQGPGQESDSALLQMAHTWANDAANLRQQLNDYLGTPGANVELVCTENNSVYSNPGKQTTSLVNGLYYADSFGQFMQTEFTTFMWWIFRNAQESGNNNSASLYGWRQYGDYGVVSAQNDRYPSYFVSKLVSRFTGPGDRVIEATTNYNLLSAYAVRRIDGSVSVLLINKDATNSLNASIALNGFVPLSTATVNSYGIPQDEAARTSIGSPDIAVSSIGGVSANFTYNVAPYSAVVLNLAPTTCPASLTPMTQFFSYTGGDASFVVSALASCNWSATATANWIRFTSDTNGSGVETVSYLARENFTGVPRQTTIQVGSKTLNIVQAANVNPGECPINVSPTSTTALPGGGTGSISVTAMANCAWQATSNSSWVTITSPAAVIGSGAVSYSVSANPGSSARKATLIIAGQLVTIKQKGS